MSFFADKKQEHETSAEKFLAEKNYAKAFFHTAKAAEFGLMLAEQCEGKIAKRYIEDAFELIDIAEKLKEKARLQNKENLDEIVMDAEKEDNSHSPFQLKEKPDNKLSDVAGLDEVKAILQEDVILPFRNPEVYERFKQKAGAGVLMYGPPGNGKTFIAKAIAGELDAAFFPVDCAMIKDKYVGETEKNMKKLFQDAQKHERSVLFFDEVESILERRGNRKINTVTQFLALTDGIATNEGKCILLLAATNKPWRLDEAALRPGRLGSHIYVGLPDIKAREAIIDYNMKDIPAEKKISFTDFAEKTEGYSGADMTEICNCAKKNAIRRQLESGTVENITTDDFISAIERTVPSVTKEDLRVFDEWRESHSNT